MVKGLVIIIYVLDFNTILIIQVAYLDTVIADTAVRTSRWSVELAGDTPLHSHSDAVYFNIFVERSPEIILPIFVCVC
jgi:hypothetical protein